MEASHGPHTTDRRTLVHGPERGTAPGSQGPERGSGHGATARTGGLAPTVSQAVAPGPVELDTRAALDTRTGLDGRAGPDGRAALDRMGADGLMGADTRTGLAGRVAGAVPCDSLGAPQAGPTCGQPGRYAGAPDVVTVPARQGLEAVDILRRGAGGDESAVGPVLHDGPCATVGFLVPPGTAAGWDVPGSACTRTNGQGFRLPSEPPVLGSGWLLPPDTAEAVTDPTRLRAALGEAARLIEAADSHR